MSQLTGSLPASWSTMTKLSKLILSGNRLAGTLPATFSTLSGMSEM
jgi:hypothetical protein